jgi:DnaJ family protein C protein 28
MPEETEDSPQSNTNENKGLTGIPPLNRWDTVMDELIEEAMRNGDFDNLPGKGKPLDLARNPFAQETELAFSLLKNNDYTLPWIAQRREIMEQIDSFRAILKQTYSEYAAEYRVTQDDMALGALEAGWKHYLNTEVVNAIQSLNKKIADANLKQPREVVEILKLNLKRELKRAEAEENLGR